ncbi:MAG TPA: hypothetical protein VLL54_19150 [Pyrinomonadaceae bacterium]|nr:hypothetical protein [Pyrinomonadaceae bacterium]
MENYYDNQQQIEDVVTGFETCATGKDEFSHASHLTVATYYLCRSTLDESFETMRAGLFRFLDYHGIDRTNYKEQLTRDWIALVHSVVEEGRPGMTLIDITNEVIRKYGKFRLPETTKDETA